MIFLFLLINVNAKLENAGRNLVAKVLLPDGNYCLSKNTRGRTKSRGTCDERAVKRFKVEMTQPLYIALRYGQETEKRLEVEGNCPTTVRMHPRIASRTGRALEEMCGDTSCVATAMIIFGVLILFAAIGCNIIFHAYQPVCVMMMRYDRHHQHDYADEQ